MKMWIAVLFLVQAVEAQIAGQWKTFDDSTLQPKSVVMISESEAQAFGSIEKIFPQPGRPAEPLCELCVGDMKNKPVIGLQILKGLKKKNETEWDGGEITDPENGKTYSCKVELIDGGKKLKVRGYLGFSLIGRTQIWERLF